MASKGGQYREEEIKQAKMPKSQRGLVAKHKGRWGEKACQETMLKE